MSLYSNTLPFTCTSGSQGCYISKKPFLSYLRPMRSRIGLPILRDSVQRSEQTTFWRRRPRCSLFPSRPFSVQQLFGSLEDLSMAAFGQTTDVLRVGRGNWCKDGLAKAGKTWSASFDPSRNEIASFVAARNANQRTNATVSWFWCCSSSISFVLCMSNSRVAMLCRPPNSPKTTQTSTSLPLTSFPRPDALSVFLLYLDTKVLERSLRQQLITKTYVIFSRLQQFAAERQDDVADLRYAHGYATAPAITVVLGLTLSLVSLRQSSSSNTTLLLPCTAGLWENISSRSKYVHANYRQRYTDTQLQTLHQSAEQVEVAELTLCSQIYAVLHVAEIVYIPADGRGDAIVTEELLDWINQTDPGEAR
jgi:hypothetical protein